MKTIRKLIRADGTETDLHGPHAIRDIAQMIGADALDIVILADRVHVMLVDDEGALKDLPVNAEATRRYHEVCIPNTTREIRGDVVIVPDSDYAREACHVEPSAQLARRAAATGVKLKNGDKDWETPCQNCEQVPTVHPVALCGPCCFGEAATAEGNW